MKKQVSSHRFPISCSTGPVEARVGDWWEREDKFGASGGYHGDAGLNVKE